METTFSISIGSHWPEKAFPHDIILPVGGKMCSITLEYKAGTDMFSALAEHIAEKYTGKEYHIWYWYTHEPSKSP